MRKYLDNDLDVEYYPFFLEEADELFDKIENMFTTFSAAKRQSFIVGNDGLEYKVVYRGSTRIRIPQPWDTIPGLYELKNRISTLTEQDMTVCVVQRYPTGKVGILPHRDKEMIPGTRICGVSLGQERVMSFGRDGYKPHKIALEHGSLYVMNDPTNQKWLHAVITDDSLKPRISLTFRSY